MGRLVFIVKPNSDEARQVVKFWNGYDKESEYTGDGRKYIIEYDECYCITGYTCDDDYSPSTTKDHIFHYTDLPSFLSFPKEIRDEMLSRTKYKSPIPFILYLQEDYGGGGFTWSDQIEGSEFWDHVINNRDFDLFYKHFNLKNNESRLSKQESPLRGGSSNITSGICCRKHKARVTVVSLGYKEVTGRG